MLDQLRHFPQDFLKYNLWILFSLLCLIDLRIMISRQRIKTDFGGQALVPQNVSRLFNNLENNKKKLDLLGS